MYTGRPPEVTVGVLKGVSTPVLKLMPYIDIVLSENHNEGKQTIFTKR